MATLLSAVIAFVTAGAVSYFAKRREDNQYRRELALQRLNELYAPLKLLLAQDAVLAAQLREGKSERAEGWHILDNINEILSDERDKTVAKQILDINKKIVGILESKSGLCASPIPDSFSTFLGHCATLERALEGRAFVKNEKFQYFPREFEAAVKEGYATVFQQLNKEAASEDHAVGEAENPGQ